MLPSCLNFLPGWKIDTYLITAVETKQKHKDHMLCNHPDYSEQYYAAGFLIKINCDLGYVNCRVEWIVIK